MVIKDYGKSVAITMTLTTIADYKQDDFNTSLQYCGNIPTECVKETNSYESSCTYF